MSNRNWSVAMKTEVMVARLQSSVNSVTAAPMPVILPRMNVQR